MHFPHYVASMQCSLEAIQSSNLSIVSVTIILAVSKQDVFTSFSVRVNLHSRLGPLIRLYAIATPMKPKQYFFSSDETKQ